MVTSKIFVDSTENKLNFMLWALLLESKRGVADAGGLIDSLPLCKRTGTRGVADAGGLTAYLCARELVHVVWPMQEARQPTSVQENWYTTFTLSVLTLRASNFIFYQYQSKIWNLFFTWLNFVRITRWCSIIFSVFHPLSSFVNYQV